MSGIFLIIILIIWFFVVNLLAKLCVSKIQPGTKKTITYIALFVLFFIAPVADDIIGGFQFRALCSPENMLIYDIEKVRGETVQYKNIPSYPINNKILPIRVTQSEWVKPNTGEVLITHKMFYAKGGWLSRFIGFPEGSPPYTFNGHCDLREYYELFNKLGIKQLKGRYGEQ